MNGIKYSALADNTVLDIVSSVANLRRGKRISYKDFYTIFNVLARTKVSN